MRSGSPPPPLSPQPQTVNQISDFVAGERLCLTHEWTGHSTELLVEPAQRGVLLAVPERPYHRLHAASQRTSTVSFKQTRGNAAALWYIETDDPASAISRGNSRVCIRRATDAPAGPSHLSLDNNGSWCLSSAHYAWRLRRNHGDDTHAQGDEQSSCLDLPPLMLLPCPTTAPTPQGTDAQARMLTQYARDGYFLIPGLISPVKVARAVRYLNHHLGSADLAVDLEPQGLGMEYVRAMETDETSRAVGVVKLGGGRTCTCCLSQAAPLLALLDGPERTAIANALGSDRPLSSLFGVQVALRFPLPPFAEGVADGDAALPSLLAAAGLDWHTDAAKYNEKKTFDVVVGVFLSHIGSAHVRTAPITAPHAVRVI